MGALYGVLLTEPQFDVLAEPTAVVIPGRLGIPDGLDGIYGII